MALQGNFNFKGIDLPNSYVMIWQTDTIKSSTKTAVEVFSEDGSPKDPQEFIESNLVRTLGGINVKVFKDVEAKNIDQDSYICMKNYTFEVATNTSAKNFVEQGYVHLKTLVEFSDFTDI